MDDKDVKKSPSPYMRWRVAPDARRELMSIKSQGYWKDKPDVEFIDYLVQLGKNQYIRSILPVEAGDTEKPLGESRSRIAK